MLQTDAYTRALITGGGLVPEEVIEPRVQARQCRQALLHRIQPPWCRFQVHECALRMPVGDRAIMNDQLLHLVFASARPQLDIRVVPMAAGPRSGPFMMMEYSNAKPVVYLENDMASVFLDGDDYVAYYRNVISRLKSVAWMGISGGPG